MPNTREKLIELLRTPIEITGGLMPPTAKMTQVFAEKIADHLIRNGVTLESYDCHWATEQAYKNGYEAGKPKWISVKDRLPLNDTYIHVTTDGVVVPAYWHNDRFFAFTANGVATVGGVTHWMPLPEAPKGE